MNDIPELLKLNLEIEGLLRILDNRDSDAAADRLSACFCEFSQKMNDFLLDLSAVADNCEAEPAVATAASEPVVEMPEEKQEPETAPVTEEPVVFVEEPAVIMEEPTEEPAPAKNDTREFNSATLMKSFTLNDRFRFRRELFAGNDDDFNETLQLIADMDSYSEAEDYLLNDMMWSRENPAVADFLEILANNMPR